MEKQKKKFREGVIEAVTVRGPKCVGCDMPGKPKVLKGYNAHIA